MSLRDLLVGLQVLWLALALGTAAEAIQSEKPLVEPQLELRYSGGVAVAGSPHGALLQVLDPWQGGPVRGARVDATLENERGETLALQTHHTDESGKARFRLPIPEGESSVELRFEVATEERTQDWSVDLWTHRDRLITYLSTDRAIYRPGESIEVRTLTLDRGRPAAGLELQLKVRDGNWDLLARPLLESSQAGVGSARIVLPDEVPSGPLFIEAESDDGYVPLRGGLVEITNESEPRFRLRAEAAQSLALRDEPWRVQVETESFLGEPIANANVEVSLRDTTRASATTDVHGKALLVVEAERTDWNRDTFQYRDETFTVQAEHPISGRLEHRTLTLRRSTYPLHVHSYWAETAVGGRRALWVVTSDAEGNPVSADVEVRSGRWKTRRPAGWEWVDDRLLGTGSTNRLGIGRVDIVGEVQGLRVAATATSPTGTTTRGYGWGWSGGSREARLEVQGSAFWRPDEPVDLHVRWAERIGTPPEGPFEIELWRYEQDSAELLEDRSVDVVDGSARLRFSPGLFGRLDSLSLGRLYVVVREPAQAHWRAFAVQRQDRSYFPRAVVFPLAPQTTASPSAPAATLTIQPETSDLNPGDTARLRLRFTRGLDESTTAVAGLTAVRASSREHQLARQGADSATAFLAPFEQTSPRNLATVGATSLFDLLQKTELDEAERLAARFLLDQASRQQARDLVSQRRFDPLRVVAQATSRRFQAAWRGDPARPQWTARRLATLSRSPEALEAALAQMPAAKEHVEALRDPWDTPYRFHASLHDRGCTLVARSAGPDRSPLTFDDFDAGSFHWPCYDATLNALTAVLGEAYDQGRPRPEGRRELIELIAELSESSPEIAALSTFTPGFAEVLDPWGQPWQVDWQEGAAFTLRLRGGPQDRPVTLTRRVVARRRILQHVSRALRDAASRGPLVATSEGLDSLWKSALEELGRRDLWDKKSGRYFLDWARSPEGTPTALTVATEGIDGVRGSEDDVTILKVSCLGSARLPAPQALETAELTVAVADSDGALLPGVTVEVCSLYDRAVAVTDAEGRATLRGLTPALLRVTATLEGFDTIETNLSARPGALLSHRFVLFPAALETITVTSEAPMLDELKMQAGSTAARGPASVNLGTPPLRRNFRKTLAFLPEIVLEGGTATVELPLSDDVTSWQIASVAHDAEGHIATAELELESDLPVYIEPDVPQRFTAGDRARLPFLLHNRTEQHRQAEWQFAADGPIRWSRAPQPHPISPGTLVRSVDAHFQTAGPAHLQAGAVTHGAHADQDVLGDSLEIPLRIEPRAYRETATVTRLLRLDPRSDATLALDLPKDRLPGLGHVETHRIERPLQLLEQAALDLERRPTGCTEQTVSAARISLALLELGSSTDDPHESGERGTRSRQHVEEAVRRVLRRQDANGAFGYWPGSARSFDLTVYVVDFLQRSAGWTSSSAEEVGRAIDWIEERLQPASEPAEIELGPTVPARTLARLADIDRRTGRSGPNSLLQRAVDWSAKAAVRAKQPRQPERTIDLASLLLAGHLTEARETELTQRLLARSRVAAEGRYWTSSTPSVFYSSGKAGSVVATALALRALLGQGVDDDLLTEGIAWLLERQGSGGSWSNTEATVEAIEAAIELWQSRMLADREEPTFEWRGGEVPAWNGELRRDLDAGPPTLTVRGGRGWTLVRLTAHYYRPWNAVEHLARHDEVSLAVDCSERGVPRQTPVACRVSGTRSFGRGMLTARIGLPPGASVDQAHLRGQRAGASALHHFEIGEDEVTLYLWPHDGRFELELRYVPNLIFDGVTKPSSLEQYYRAESRVVLPPRRVSVVADAP